MTGFLIVDREEIDVRLQRAEIRFLHHTSAKATKKALGRGKGFRGQNLEGSYPASTKVIAERAKQTLPHPLTNEIGPHGDAQQLSRRQVRGAPFDHVAPERDDATKRRWPRYEMGEQVECRSESAFVRERPVESLGVDGTAHETNDVIVPKRRHQNGSAIRAQVTIEHLEETGSQLSHESGSQFRFVNPGDCAKVVPARWHRKPVDSQALKKWLTHRAARSLHLPPKSVTLTAGILTRRPLACTFKPPRHMAGGTFARRSGPSASR
jgi:hypothetical protein